MDIVSILVVLIVVGAILYLADLLPIDATVKTIIRVIAIVAVLIWLLQAFVPALHVG